MLPQSLADSHVPWSPHLVEAAEGAEGAEGDGEFEDDGENQSISGNLPDDTPARSPVPPLPPSQSPALRIKYLSKRSEEIQLERPKLTPKKTESLRPRRQQEKKEFSPKPSKVPSRSAAVTTASPQTKAKVQTPQKVADPKPTYQQRMEAWLKQPDRPAEASNPFLEVLKDK
jgi:hypothetical protein